MNRTDFDLLLGILALQNGFIDQPALIAAFQVWREARSRALAEILEQRGDLSAPRRALLVALVEEHVRGHDDDPGLSLASLSSDGGARAALLSIDDEGLHDSLARVGAARPRDDNPLNLAISGSLGAPGTITFEPSESHGRFRVLRPHARGGLGAVVVALDAELHREVALKQIQAAYADHPESRARFVLEAEITGGLEHPGIVPVYSLGHDPDGRPFYAMRFIQGDSLKEAIERFHRADVPGRDPGERTLAFQKLLRRFLDVCNAIAYAHSRGVLHRDIKPGNVMVGPFGETLVVDWGLAKVVGTEEGASAAATLRPPSASGSHATLTGSALGTPQFMSPEQAAGDLARLGPASDVYSLGATLFCLLTGRAPIAGGATDDVLARVRRGDFAAPRKVNPRTPPALEAVCLKAMALRPEDRYDTPRALAEEVEHWLADEPVSARREPWSTRARRWMRRHRTLVTAAAVALVVALAGLSVGLVLLDRARRRESDLNVKLTDANARLTQALGRVEAANATADRRLDQTMQAIEDYYTGVGEEVLLGQPEFQSLRARLLEKPRAFYESMNRALGSAAERDDRSTFLLARGRMELGKLLKLLARREEACEQWRAAIALFDPLAASHPAETSYREELAACHNNLAATKAELGDHRAAVEGFQKAIGLLEGLAASRSTRPSGIDPLYPRKILTGSYRGLGEVSFRLGDHRGAADAHHKAIELAETLLAERPDDAESAELLVGAQVALAVDLSAQGDHRAALDVERQALESAESLRAAHPDVPKYLRVVSVALSNLGHTLELAGDSAGAVQAQRRAVDLSESLVKTQPNVPDHRAFQAMAERNLAGALEKSGDNAGAISLCRQSADRLEELVRAHPGVPDFRFRLAATRGQLSNLLELTGDLEGALAESRKSASRYDELSREQPAVVTYRNGLGISYHHLGGLLTRRGDLAGASREYRRSVELREAIVAEHPEVPDYRSGLASTYLSLAEVLSGTGDHSGARAVSRRAIELAEALTRARPDWPPYRASLASALREEGVCIFRSGDLPGAGRALEQARSAIEALTRASPDDPSYRIALIEVLSMVGAWAGLSADAPKAVRALQQAVTEAQALSVAHPEVPRYQYEQAKARVKLGIVKAQTGQPMRGLEDLRGATRIIEPLVAAHPNVLDYRQTIAGGLAAEGMVLAGLGRNREAVEPLEKAVAHARVAVEAAPTGIEYRSGFDTACQDLVRALLAVGRVEQAARVARGRLELSPGQVELYNAACELALCSAASDAVQAEALAAEAVAALRAAVAAGWNDAAHTAADPDLTVLRHRDDFRAVLAKLLDAGFPRDPFTFDPK